MDKKWVKRLVLGMIAFNVVNFFQLFFYSQVPNKSSGDGNQSFGLQRVHIDEGKDLASETQGLKPWTNTPSFKPWTRDPKLEPNTCEAYFGYGFTEEHVVLQPPSQRERGEDKLRADTLRSGSDAAGEGSFRCLFSQTLQTSVCEGTQVVMNLDKITVSRGGEAIDDVIGRGEEDELPLYSHGAFQVQVASDREQKSSAGASLFDRSAADHLMPTGQIGMHTLRSLLLNLETVNSATVLCNKRVEQPTVIVTRFEYANLFHTSTDWFSAYISSRIAGLDFRPHLVLLDGHCESPMDDGWKAMFSSVTYAKHLSGPVCFDHVIFAPLGYDIPLFKFIGSTLNCVGCSVEELQRPALKSKEGKTARLREFGEFFVKSFQLQSKNLPDMSKKIQEVNVLFVRREDYLAHPRHNGKPESRLHNEAEVFEDLKAWAVEKSSNVLNVIIVNGLLAHMTLQEQIQAVTEADVLVGAHGAGLTHLIFAKPTAVVLELSSPSYKRPHFQTLSHWMGMDYRVIHMTSSSADVTQVRKSMNEILRDASKQKGM